MMIVCTPALSHCKDAMVILVPFFSQNLDNNINKRGTHQKCENRGSCEPIQMHRHLLRLAKTFAARKHSVWMYEG